MKLIEVLKINENEVQGGQCREVFEDAGVAADHWNMLTTHLTEEL